MRTSTAWATDATEGRANYSRSVGVGRVPPSTRSRTHPSVKSRNVGATHAGTVPQSLPSLALYWPPETPVDLRHAVVAASLRVCSFRDLPNDPGFGTLVTHWLTDDDSWEWFPPPPTEARLRPSAGS
jgi:hypothetical protein